MRSWPKRPPTVHIFVADDGSGRTAAVTEAAANTGGGGAGALGRVVPTAPGLASPMVEGHMPTPTEPSVLAAEQGLFYNGFVLTFSSPEVRADFDDFMLTRRLIILRASAALALALGCIIAIAVELPEREEPGRYAVVALLLAGGVAGGLAGLLAPPALRRACGAAATAMYAWLMGLVTAAYILCVESGDKPGQSAYGLSTKFLLLVLFLLALLGPAAQAPALVVAAAETAVGIGLLLDNLRMADTTAGDGDGARAIAAAICSAAFLSALLAAWSMALMWGNVTLFTQSTQLRRVHDAQARVRIREEAERQKRDYVAQTLHDVGTPLATFALAIETLKTGGPVDAEHLEILRTCECAIELMTLTRRKAIDYAKYSTGKELRPRLGSTDVRDLVLTKCRRIMSGFNSATTVPIRFNVDPGIAKYVVTDGDFLWECLVNYLSNAVKFTNEGEINCNVFKVTPDRLRFEVRDNGIGIPHERKQQLFQPFAQLQKFAAGTGLGLWSVKQKILALQGEVGMHVNPGGGSVFFFDVPYRPDFVLESALEDMKIARSSSSGVDGIAGAAARAADNGSVYGSAAPQNAGASSSEAPPALQGAVLLVDSRQATLEVAQALLGTHGFQVERATNGFEGLCRMQKRMYSAVLVDYHVMVLDALQVLQKFRDWEESSSAKRAEKQFVCVMFSGAPPEVELNAAINSGADAVWTDPLIPDSDDIVMMLEDERKARQGKASAVVPVRTSPRRRGNHSRTTSAGSNASAAAAASTGGAVAAALAPDPQAVLGHVLLIEDELSILKFEQKMFQRHGFRVDTATNGEEGLQRMKEQMFDAVFTDIMMPVMDGFETVRRFRRWEEEHVVARPHRQLVYAVSANASEQDHNMARMVGMDGFASKPVKVKELVELVRQRRLPA